MGLLGASVFELVKNVFRTIGGELLGLEGVLLFAGIAVAVLIICTVVAICFTVELKTSHAVLRINNYLAEKPFVTADNLVEFNRLLKRIPKPMREQWQKYMINRTDKPSKYMNITNCVDKPLRTSKYRAITRNYIKAFITIIAVLTFGLTLGAILSSPSQTLADTLLISATLPMVVVIIGVVFNLIINFAYNALLNDVYYNFEIFEVNIDRAVTSMPKVVDYEILFTRREILNGIPALQEYLEQRALQEEEELAKARDKEVEHETYDFTKLGVNGSLVMERSLKESEFYLGNRKRLLTEIEQISSEKDSIERQYDEKNKASQRKLRDIRETLDRLKEKLSVTTNKIIGNDIRKQQADEVRKQQIIETEMDEDLAKYEAEISRINGEIDKRKDEIEKSKKYVEKSLNDEFSDFSTKIYKDIRAEVNEEVKQGVEDMKQEIITLQAQNEEKERIAIEKQVLIDERDQTIEQINQQLEEKIEAINELTLELNSKGKKKGKDKDGGGLEIKEVYRYFDFNGNEFFYDSNGEPYFIDENNNIVYYKDLSDETEQEQYVEQPQYEEEQEQPQYEEEQEQQYEEEQEEPQVEHIMQDAVEQAHYDEEQSDEAELSEEPNTDNDHQFETLQDDDYISDDEIPPFALRKDDAPLSDEQPPKYVEQHIEKEPVVEVKKVAGKRGRPKKEKTDEVVVKKTAGKRGRPKKEKSDEPVKKVSKGRGRPKKDNTKVETKKATGKRGRPKKEKNDEPVKKVSKGRGRPKKDSAKVETKKATGKRGRPKKEKSDEVVKKVSKGRGRPPKSAVQKVKPKNDFDTGDDSGAKVENDNYLDKLEDIQNVLRGVNQKLEQQKNDVEDEKTYTLNTQENEEDINSQLKDMLSSLDDEE